MYLTTIVVNFWKRNWFFSTGFYHYLCTFFVYIYTLNHNKRYNALKKVTWTSYSKSLHHVDVLFIYEDLTDKTVQWSTNSCMSLEQREFILHEQIHLYVQSFNSLFVRGKAVNCRKQSPFVTTRVKSLKKVQD